MENNIMLSGEPLSREKFNTPSKEFGIVPFWFWNGKMTHDEIEYQLKECRDKGCPGFYIHARFGGMEDLGYMNEEWLERVSFTIQKAQELGLQVWIYDEYNWPSGTCNQTIMKDHPEMTNVYLELIQGDLPGNYFTFLEGTDSRYFDMEQSEPVFACAVRLDDMQNGKYEILDLTPSMAFDKVITWEVPEGYWKLFYFIERKSSWYADVLNPETTRKFIEYTHERYKAYLNGDIARQIKGFFTDEPAMHYFMNMHDNFTIPWTHGIFSLFRERNGYDLKKNLPKLFFDFGGDTEQVRYDFWSTLTDRYEKSYFGELESWCESNGIVSTGHLLHEESLRLHARANGNLFKLLKHFHVTGVDHLYPRIGTKYMESEHVALKIASSAAHQNGSGRLVCESLGGSFWDCTMERMKWVADWEYVLGVNQLIPHGFHYTIEGERKRDWPASMFCQATWWEHYGLFNDYMTRLGYLLSGGDHVAKVAVLYPINSIWANYMPNQRTKISELIEREFDFLADRMLRLHIDYDYIDEDVLNDNAEITDGKICIRGERYEMLLLPPCTHIKGRTLQTLEHFVAEGGKVAGDTLLPYACLDRDGENLSERIAALFGVGPLVLKEHFLNGTGSSSQELIFNDSGSGKCVFASGEGFKANPNEACSVSLLDRMLRACVTPEIEIDNEDVFYLHRIKGGTDLFFIVNTADAAADVSVRFKGTYAPERWNIETGEIQKLPIYKVSDGFTVLPLHFEPIGSAVIALHPAGKAVHAVSADIELESIDAAAGTAVGYGRLEHGSSIVIDNGSEERIISFEAKPPLAPIPFNGVFDFSTDRPNSLNISTWKMAFANADDDAAMVSSGSFDTGSWLDVQMGGWEMQLPVERENGTYPVDLWYVAEFYTDYLPEDLSLLIDGFKGSSYRLYMNGCEIIDTPIRSFLDAQIGSVPITAYARIGKNTIALRLTVTKRGDGLLDMLKVVGSFSVRQSDRGEAISVPAGRLVPGDWTTLGYPYYSGTGYYTGKINISKEYLSRKLMLKADVGKDVLTVTVNGKHVKTCLWKPYEADITPYLHEGENTITLGVVNTLINLLESKRKPSGLFNAEILPFDRYMILI